MVEGIRNACQISGTHCHFNSKFDDNDLLTNGWSGIPLQRIHPPIPDYKLTSETGEFHYCFPEYIQNYSFEEKFSLTKIKIPANAGEREINIYCPRAHLKKMIANCGTPVLSFQQEEHEDSSMRVNF